MHSWNRIVTSTTPDLTVLICTLNRPQSLAETLSLLALNDVQSVSLDVVVIDNSSDGSARKVVDSMAIELEVRYLHEPKPGKYHALNRGLSTEHLAPIIVVLDDDMSPGRDWCRGVLEVCNRWPQAGVFAASSYVIWPEGIDIPEWIRPRSVSCWALSVVEYSSERTSKPGEFMSGNYFWFRKSAVGGRRFPEFWAPEAHFTLGLIEDGATGVMAPEPRCGHRVQPELLDLSLQRKRAVLLGRHLPRFRLGFTKTVPQAKQAATHPIAWKVRCAANLLRWLLIFASIPFRKSTNRIPVELSARLGIANNWECLWYATPEVSQPT